MKSEQESNEDLSITPDRKPVAKNTLLGKRRLSQTHIAEPPVVKRLLNEFVDEVQVPFVSDEEARVQLQTLEFQMASLREQKVRLRLMMNNLEVTYLKICDDYRRKVSFLKVQCDENQQKIDELLLQMMYLK